MALSDTSDAAARVQLDLLRKCGCERRAQLMRSMTRTVIELSRAALREQLPSVSESDMLMHWVDLQYGRDLGQRVRSYVAARDE